MYGIAITYAVASLLLLGGFAYITFKMTSRKWNAYNYQKNKKDKIDDLYAWHCNYLWSG